MFKKILKNHFVLSLILINFVSAREIIKNGEFDNDFNSWTDWRLNGDINYEKEIDTTSLLSGSNSAKFDILTGSNTDWHIQFHSTNFTIQKTANYYTSFYAGFEGAQETISLPVTLRNTSGANPILIQKNFDLPSISDASDTTHQFVYQADTTMTGAHLNFFLGGHNEVEIWFDLVSIIEEGPFWLNTPFDDMDDAVEVKFNVFPDSAFKGVIGLTQDAATTDDDLACALYFEPNGTLKALNGTNLQADEYVEYEKDKRVAVTIFANISKQYYDVKVKPTGQKEKTLATRYAFKKPSTGLNNIVSNTFIDPNIGGRPKTSMLVNGIKTTAQTGVEQRENIPTRMNLIKNFPNPFNPTTTIEFSLTTTEHISIDIFNSMGEHVKNILNSSHASGKSQIVWNATDQIGRQVPSGVYYVRLKSDRIETIHKMMLLR